MDFGFEMEEMGENLIVHFKKNIPGWKRFASELISDGLVSDRENARKMFEEKGDVIVYEVYHLLEGMEKIKRIYKKTGIACHLTFLNFGVFSTSNDGELFFTYGHIHKNPMGEAFTVLKNECLFVLTDNKSHKTYIIRLKEGNSILVPPEYLHRIVSFKKDCLIIDFVPNGAGHNYSIVKSKGFPFHIFYEKKKLKIVKDEKYKNEKFELVKKTASKINPMKLFEKEPKKLKDILENPEKYKNLYFIKR
jgi:oxalate decarboxylase/phosphoglucose isomerase-like protein (cupin superfamily)